jgi:E3 ubiquitin-protein ligase makorin
VLSNAYVPGAFRGGAGGGYASNSRGGGGGGGGGGGRPDLTEGLDEASAAYMRTMMEEGVDFGEDGMGGFGPGGPDLEEDPDQLCEMHVEGRCPESAETCFYVHGDVCPHCKLGILHPYYPEESAQHVLSCEVEVSIIEQLRASRDIECSVCFEKVIERGRKFGLLEGCNHPFCLECIRSWRTTYDQSNNIVRACPVCRTHSYLVTPCAYMPQSDESKEAVVEAYKERLASIPCKLFAGGEGTCPFGTSCFFLHRNKDGSVPESAPVRKTVGADGSVAVVGQVTLSDFLFSSRSGSREDEGQL